MRILQLIMARQYRGAEVFANQLSHELVRAGHDVMLVALYTAGTRTFKPEAVPYEDLVGRKRGFSVRLLWRLYKTIKRFRPDVVQANAGDTLKYAVLVKLIFRLRFRLVFRNASTISQYLANPLKRNLQGLLFRATDKVASVSNLSKKDIVSLFPFLSERTKVIPVGIDPGASIPSMDKETERLFYHRPVFIHVGGFTFEKNHEGLIRIFDRCRATGIPGTLLLVGDGPLIQAIQEQVKDSTMDQHVHFLASRTDVLTLIQNSDALVLPSIIEGLPAVILEAFFARTPVIAYDVGGIHEIVKPGVTGWLVPKGDEDGFFKAMMEVAGSPPDLEVVVENAKQLAHGAYSNRNIAAEFINLYKDATDGKS